MFFLIKKRLFLTAVAYSVGSVILGVAALIGSFALIAPSHSR